MPAPKAKPITIRFSAREEMALQMVPHQILESFRGGTATEPDWHGLALRLNLGRMLAEWHFPDHLDQAQCAQVALQRIKERAALTGEWATEPLEFQDIGVVLNLTDAMQKLCTHRELREAVRYVLSAAT